MGLPNLNDLDFDLLKVKFKVKFESVVRRLINISLTISA